MRGRNDIRGGGERRGGGRGGGVINGISGNRKIRKRGMKEKNN